MGLDIHPQSGDIIAACSPDPQDGDPGLGQDGIFGSVTLLSVQVAVGRVVKLDNQDDKIPLRIVQNEVELFLCNFWPVFPVQIFDEPPEPDLAMYLVLLGSGCQKLLKKIVFRCRKKRTPGETFSLGSGQRRRQGWLAGRPKCGICDSGISDCRRSGSMKTQRPAAGRSLFSRRFGKYSND